MFIQSRNAGIIGRREITREIVWVKSWCLSMGFGIEIRVLSTRNQTQLRWFTWPDLNPDLDVGWDFLSPTEHLLAWPGTCSCLAPSSQKPLPDLLCSYKEMGTNLHRHAPKRNASAQEWKHSPCFRNRMVSTYFWPFKGRVFRKLNMPENQRAAIRQSRGRQATEEDSKWIAWFAQSRASSVAYIVVTSWPPGIFIPMLPQFAANIRWRLRQHFQQEAPWLNCS